MASYSSHDRESHAVRPIEVEIPVRAPFAADQLLAFLAHRAVTGVEHLAGRTYARTLRLPHGPATVQLRLPALGSPATVSAVLRLSDPTDLDDAAAGCRRLLDADADPRAIDAALAGDPALRELVAELPGIRLPGAVDGPEIVFRALLGQQVSVAAARTALTRLTLRIDDRLPAAQGPLTHLFPSPAAVAALEGIPGPGRRSATILSTAAAMASGELAVHAGRNTAELTAELVARPGIGPWTAGYVAMRVLGDPDVLLTGDLALRHGAGRLGLPTDPRELAARGGVWSPFRSYAGLHLWRAAATASS